LAWDHRVLVHAVTTEGFRNLGAITLVANRRFNVLHGDNGQGKTNLLEAVYVLATLRSFRTNRLEELVRFGDTQSLLRARVEHRQLERIFGVDISLSPARKQALCDGKPARTSDYFGGFNVVLFAPEDLALPKGPPSARRRFLDRAIWNTFPGYLDDVRTYDRLLRSRNVLLRQAQPGYRKKPRSGPISDEESSPEPLAPAAPRAALGPLPDVDHLDIYDERLAAAGALLIARRRRYLDAVAPGLASAFAAISGSQHEVGLRYAPSLRRGEGAADGELATLLGEQLQRDRRRDLLRGFTHSGPHADDWVLELDGRAAEQHASQGQTRALVLALKIAEIQHLDHILGDPPVLLLDDVSSELDGEKNAALFDFLRGSPSQVFITTTSSTHIQVPTGADRQDFSIRDGKIAA
jgi:DNA replication and repair protein RecF